VPPSVHHGLVAVAGLRVGRSEAVESEPVRPVPMADVHAMLPHVSAQVGAMIQLQLVTGMRPGECCLMRGMDINTTGKLWVYAPRKHKTLHHGHTRLIYLGPKAQEIIRPFLKTDLSAYLFDPRDAEQARRNVLTEKRKTPKTYGNRPGTNRKRKPMRTAGERYTSASYRVAVWRACDKADQWAKGGIVIGDEERIVPRWHPHQLRHTAATELRRTHGLEAAQVILGHKTLTVTQVYAEKNVAEAMRIMSQVG
jgi:integrase